MATLNIRNLPEDVHRRLRIRAARAGRSMEAEAREIITAACRNEPEQGDVRKVQAFVRHLYGGVMPGGQVDALIEERRREAAGE